MRSSTLANSVGVVVTFRNRDPQMVLNLMRALAAQTRPPEAMALVNFGTPCPELETAVAPFHYVYRHLPQRRIWNRPLAANQGVRLLPEVESVLFFDADVLPARNFIECGLRRLEKGILLNCTILDLPEGAVTPETDVVRDYERLKSLTKPRPEITALGVCLWLRTPAVWALRGRDETYKMWCFEDVDFQRRARWLGLQPVRLEDETSFLHQWHRSKDRVYDDPEDPESKSHRYWYRKNLNRLMSRSVLWDVGRFAPGDVNPRGWGKMDQGASGRPDPRGPV